MIKKLTKTNISLLIITLCTMLFCGLFAINNLSAQKVPTAHAATETTLIACHQVGTYNKGAYMWFTPIKDYEVTIKKITITTDNTKIPSSETILHSWDVSEEQDGSLTAYLYKSNNIDEIVIHADVDVIYSPSNSYGLFGPWHGEETNEYVDHFFANVETISLENFDTSRAEKMNHMFSGCAKLTTIEGLDKFVTSNVTTMEEMFSGCASLQTLNLTNFNTQNLQYMCYMFAGCTSLQSLDISNFDLSAIKTSNEHIEDSTYHVHGVFGVSNDYVGNIMGGGYTYEQIVEMCNAYMEQDPKSASIMLLYANSYIFSENLQSLKLPSNMAGLTLYISPNVELYVNGNENSPLSKETSDMHGEAYAINSTYQNMVLKTLNENTPSTGFVDEQLLPALTIGLVSIITVVAICKKKKFNI